MIAWTLARLERATGAASRPTRGRRADADADPTIRDAGRLPAGRPRRREQRAEDLALGALVVLGRTRGAAASSAAVCARAIAETRAQAIEALDSLGDRRLSGALVRLLELDVDRDARPACGGCPAGR